MILYRKIRCCQREFVAKLRNELIKVKLRIMNKEEINEFLEDILRYFDGEGDEDEYETNQHLIGM